jgi:hypothetical protein
MDEVDEWAVDLSARVNGETWAEGTTRDRQFSFAEVAASGIGVLRNPVGPRQVALPGASLSSYTGAPRIGNRR